MFEGTVICPLTKEARIVALAGREAGGIAAAWFGDVLGLVFVPPQTVRMLRAG